MIRHWRLMLAALCLSSVAQAQNYGFESNNLSGWTASSTGTQSATGWSGNGQGVSVVTGVTNYSPGGGLTWNITPYGSYMAAVQAGAGAVTFDSMTGSLGLTSTQNQAIKSMLVTQSQTGGGNPTPTNAAWVKRDVELKAGTTYVYAWQYLSTDYTPYNDGSIATLVHKTDPSKVPTLNNSNSNYALLGFTNPGTGNYSTGSYGATGWQLATFVVPVDGIYTLGFASFNLGDTALSPILLIDEMQGSTTLNGQSFDPVPPNAGSTAPTTGTTTPTLCCGGSSDPFSADTTHVNKVNTFTGRITQDSKVYVEQIGSYNTVIVQQTGTKNNYAEYNGQGDNNTVNISQSTTNSTATNYSEVNVTGNSNTVNVTQQSSGGNKSAFVTVNDHNNNVTLLQKDSGSHYADIRVTGGSKTVNVTQEGSGNHQARVELSGAATSLTLTQSGSTGQSYSIQHNCSGSCNPISVTQGQ
jgi:hypothetical protein